MRHTRITIVVAAKAGREPSYTFWQYQGADPPKHALEAAKAKCRANIEEAPGDAMVAVHVEVVDSFLCIEQAVQTAFQKARLLRR